MPVPADFVWGVASSSYQIEGGAGADGRSPSVWDTFCQREGAVFNGESGETACDHYTRYEEDAQLIADLGASAYRLSIAWPRVLPEGLGRVNEKGLAFYDRLVDALLARGVQPWITLYHWDHPQAIQDLGGWMSRESGDWFAEYAGAVVARLSDRVSHWMTLNEPQIFLGLGHIDGAHAPGLKLSRKESLQASHHALLAHGKGVQAIRANASGDAHIGWAPVGDVVAPIDDTPASIDAARQLMFTIRQTEGNWAFNNPWFADPVVLGHYPEEALKTFAGDTPEIRDGDLEIISQPIDFYGMNTDTAARARMGPDGPELVEFEPGFPRTAFGWPVVPEALYWGPRFLIERYKLPIYVTENGLASMDWVGLDGKVNDPGRIDFLARYLGQLERAIADGVDVRGYFQWSILDNFEWAEGYKMRFGLVHVDYQTLERTPKASYWWYRDVIARGGV
ncbi:MAG: GH1 family beta-glucosidase [Phycisphaerales bacterium JB059]